jgi:putative transposase
LKTAKQLIERTLQEDLWRSVGAAPYQRNPDRCGWRNGCYRRNFITEVGVIEGLRVPRARESGAKSQVLEQFARQKGQLRGLVREMFLSGVSTRRVGEVLEPIIGVRLSASTVSRLTMGLDREVASFLSRRIEDEFHYLILDGVTMKVRSGGKVKKRLVLTAYGIIKERKRQIISYRLARAESEAEWEAFLSDLFRRGLEGKKLMLVVSDGCPGLGKALDTVYPYVERQSCWVHKMRNVVKRVPKRLQGDCLPGAKSIYLAENQREAVRRFKDWAQAWRGQVPEAVACIERDMELLIAFYKCPREDWRKVRTTNAIERAFREVRRRTRPMSSFTNPDSCRRIAYGVFSHLNKSWENRLQPQSTQLT